MRLRLLALLSTMCLVVTAVSATSAIAADPTVTISGTVLGDDGRGLEGAEVRIWFHGGDPAQIVQTGPDGTYSLTVPREDGYSYNMKFSNGTGWNSRDWSVSPRDGQNPTDVNAQLVRYGTIRGAITSPGSVENVAVHLREEGVGHGDLVLTDAGGNYVFDHVVPGHYWINFTTDSFDRSYYSGDADKLYEYIDVEPGDDITLRTVGPQPEWPAGELVADLTGTLLSHPEVSAVRADQPGVRSRTILTDAKVATIEDLSPGRYKVALSGASTWFGGLSEASATPVSVAADQTTTISAKPGIYAWVQGTVVNAAGEPLPGLNVEVLRMDSPGEVIADLVTSPVGSFEGGDLPDADYFIRVSDPTGAYVTRTFDALWPEHDREDRYQLERTIPVEPAYPGPATASASGTYIGHRSPGTVCFVPTSGRVGAEVVCDQIDHETKRYDIPAIKPGAYKVRGGGPAREVNGLIWLGGRSFTSATTITVAPGEHKDVDVPGVPDNGHFMGEIFGQTGVPMPHITVLAYAADNPDEIIASDVAYRDTFGRRGLWSIYSLPTRPYKLKFVDGTGRYESTWLGGSSFATATAVAPWAVDTRWLPEVTLRPRLGALAPPVISGPTEVGRTLTTTPGFWSFPGLTHSYQWLRNGSPIPGAGAASYRLADSDAGRRISVRVDGRNASGVASTTSAQTDAVTTPPDLRSPAGRIAPKVRTTVKRLGGGKVRLTVAYSGRGVTPTGRISVKRGSKTVMSWRYLKNGKLSVTLKRQPKGRARYTVRYSGSNTYLPKVTRTSQIRVR